MKFLDQASGKGGDVWVEAVDGLNTLIDYRYQQHFKASTGGHGMGRNRNGANADDVILKVPVGTQIYEEDNETLIADLDELGQRYRIAKGGNGGFGNAHFKTSTNQAPRRVNPGLEGKERWLWLRLKLIADAGLVGLPNAGKSTFLASVTSAKPKIADYPFTTLHPNLGVTKIDNREFVIADIPGLIEGAHEGVGIGDRFLGHVERTAKSRRLALMLVSASSYKRIVIKIGSALLVDKTRGLKREWLNSLCADVHMLREADAGFKVGRKSGSSGNRTDFTGTCL